MKSGDFATLAVELSAFLRDSGAVPSADAWEMFAGIFDVKPSASVSNVCKVMSGVSIGPSRLSNNQPRVELIIECLPALERLFEKISKAALVKDLRLIGKAMAPFREMEVSDFITQIAARLMQPSAKKKLGTNLDLVDRYVASLEQTFRDEAAFKLAYAALKSDQSAKGPELKEIAKRFAGAGGKSKAESLNSIWRHHEVILIDRAKAAATGGRTAA